MSSKKKLVELRSIAAKLPAITTQEKKLFAGSEILKYKPQAKDAEGNPIQSDRAYHVEVPVPKNHYRAMKKLLKKGGVNAVNDYIREMNEVVKGKAQLMDSLMGGLQERYDAIKIL